MIIREIVQADREAYRQLRSTLDDESLMWGADSGEREKKLGYVEEGIRKEPSLLNGKFADEVYMAKVLQ